MRLKLRPERCSVAGVVFRPEPMTSPAAKSSREANASLAPPLWRQLQGAARVLQQVQQGRSVGPLLEQIEPGLRPGVQALSYLALRRLGTAQSLRSLLARQRPPAAADSLLCCALALAPAFVRRLAQQFGAL